MSDYVTGTAYNSGTGFFEVTTISAAGEAKTQSMNFTTLCMMFSLTSLQAQDEVFAAQFVEAQDQVSTLTMINDCMQMFNSYEAKMDPDAENQGDRLDGLTGMKYVDENGNQTSSTTGTMVCTCEPGSDFEKWYNTYYPELVETGLVNDPGIGVIGSFYYEELDAFMTNLQSAQSTVSSQNEQQMLLTNDAASKRSTVLQLAQSLLQQAVEGRKSAAQS